MSAGISAIRVPAIDTHTATIIWLHGLGDTGRGWSFLAKYVDMPVCPLRALNALTRAARQGSSGDCDEKVMSSGSFLMHRLFL